MILQLFNEEKIVFAQQIQGFKADPDHDTVYYFFYDNQNGIMTDVDAKKITNYTGQDLSIAPYTKLIVTSETDKTILEL